MRSAPGIVYPLGRFSWSWVCGLPLWCLAAVVNAVLYAQSALAASHAAFSAAVLLILLITSLREFRGSLLSAQLQWNGEQWHVEHEFQGIAVLPLTSVVVVLDLQQALLLRLDGADADVSGRLQQWVWLYKGFAPEHWHGLRCAVYSRQPSDRFA
jgi:hypothetical protein